MSDYRMGLTLVDALPNCGECKLEVCEFVGYELGKVPALYCGGCSTAEGVRLISELRIGKQDDMNITIEYPSVDGFTLWATDSAGYLVHRRFIGYTLREAKSLFRAELNGKVTT